MQDPTPTIQLITTLREQGARVAPQLEIDAVVDAVVRTWGDALGACVEATAYRGVAAVDMVAMQSLICRHSLSCTVRECATALLHYCSEYVFGPADWQVD